PEGHLRESGDITSEGWIILFNFKAKLFHLELRDGPDDIFTGDSEVRFAREEDMDEAL
ncbi:hypothetical protein Tco_1558509, partial [Tanacetum coccineum]